MQVAREKPTLQLETERDFDMTDYEVSVQQLNDLLTDENGDFHMPSKNFNEVHPGIVLGDQ